MDNSPILISETKVIMLAVLDFLQDYLTYEMKGLPYKWRLYEVEPAHIENIYGPSIRADITLNGRSYKVDSHTLDTILRGFESEGVFEIIEIKKFKDGHRYDLKKIDCIKVREKRNFLLASHVHLPDEAPRRVLHKAMYLEDLGILRFLNEEILISKSRDSREHTLLKTIFTEPQKQWAYFDLSEVSGEEDYSKSDWKKSYYLPLNRVNKKVEKATGLANLILLANTSAQINPDYL